MTFDDDVLLVRRSGLVLAASAMSVASGAVLAATGQPSAVALGSALAWLGVAGVLYAWSRNPGAIERRARVHADARGLRIDGRLAIAASRVEAGWVEPRAGAPPLVHVRARGPLRGCTLVARDLDAARDLLRALGVDATRVSAEYWAMARPLGEPQSFARAATVLALVVALGIVAGQAAPAALALAVVALVVAFVGCVAPTAVTVGADGVLLRWLGTLRFVPWASVGAIEAFDGGVLLAITRGGGSAPDRGSWLTLRMPGDHARHHPERDAMVERMRQAWRDHGWRRDDGPERRIVCRSGGRTREWVCAMRAIAAAPVGYRVAAVAPEHLWRIVEDCHADRVARTGAAIALAPTLDEMGRDRLRAAASGAAEPRLRIALATAATDAAAIASDEDLAAVLDAIESEGDDAAAAAN